MNGTAISILRIAYVHECRCTIKIPLNSQIQVHKKLTPPSFSHCPGICSLCSQQSTLQDPWSMMSFLIIALVSNSWLNARMRMGVVWMVSYTPQIFA